MHRIAHMRILYRYLADYAPVFEFRYLDPTMRRRHTKTVCLPESSLVHAHWQHPAIDAPARRSDPNQDILLPLGWTTA